MPQNRLGASGIEARRGETRRRLDREATRARPAERATPALTALSLLHGNVLEHVSKEFAFVHA